MDEWFGIELSDVFAICLTALGVYIAVLVFTRIAGKRSFSKMSSHDFAMTVAIGSILATTILSKSTSMLQGIVGLAAVYCLQLGAALLRRIDFFQNLMDNKPMFLMDGPRILHENLRKARVTEGDLRAKLREANVLRLDDIRAVIFETTGDISVLHINDSNKTIEDYITCDVLK
ncbi:Protein of unknown function [Flavobacteriaceae bacterium MAR_2010_188]|nr:Protein of unknown function [Flavobacteriaceae bacterium MAR_2010_188]